MELARVSAVVTGATSGLGTAVAHALVKRGARVALLARSRERGEEVAAALGENALFTAADVAQSDEVQAALGRAFQCFGAINVLVNCAGINTLTRALGRDGAGRLDDFIRVVQVNLIGTFNCIRLAAALMARNEPTGDGERGVIVNTSSAAATDGQAGQAAYAASKAGIAGMTLPLARELSAHGIRVMTLSPGLFETPMLLDLPDAVRASLQEQLLFPRRFGRPEEYADLVLHTIENVMLTGETIRVDGGLRMRFR